MQNTQIYESESRIHESLVLQHSHNCKSRSVSLSLYLHMNMKKALWHLGKIGDPPLTKVYMNMGASVQTWRARP